MRVLTSRPRRMVAATALFSAITLTGVGAAQATATTTHGGGKGSGSSSAVTEAGKAFGSCMREHGLKNFPDLVIQKDTSGSRHHKGGVKVDVRVTAKSKGKSHVGDRFDPTSKAYKRALKACGPILDKVGVPLPVPPGDAHCKVIKGGKGEHGLPKLPDSPQTDSQGPGRGSEKGSEKGTTQHKEVCMIKEKGTHASK
ncbi:hypothetical protein [Streptomyces beijiangensis]|uniref:Uncharacterized protein n=1 Tax=Streptomyces beijiangensis TaxID=163361 RepID=A0A939FB42_9ACTN|nr:hypothetical protein [Streptomyces beijiangensis]MBO0515024.1 hypothetical protein [Streptomyces beijiangensis]